jgi:NADH:ubiquinone oxidoreductase subunit C
LSQLEQLSDLASVDMPTKIFRFKINLILLSLKYNCRITISLKTDEFTSISSSSYIFNSAIWLEREAWDLLGIKFHTNPDLRRILTDYGFNGHPLRKDFPVSGFSEHFFNDTKKRIAGVPIKLTQAFRVFNLQNNWKKNSFFKVFDIVKQQTFRKGFSSNSIALSFSQNLGKFDYPCVFSLIEYDAVRVFADHLTNYKAFTKSIKEINSSGLSFDKLHKFMLSQQAILPNPFQELYFFLSVPIDRTNFPMEATALLELALKVNIEVAEEIKNNYELRWLTKRGKLPFRNKRQMENLVALVFQIQQLVFETINEDSVLQTYIYKGVARSEKKRKLRAISATGMLDLVDKLVRF